MKKEEQRFGADIVESLEGGRRTSPEVAAILRWAESVDVARRLDAFRREHSLVFRGPEEGHTHEQHRVFGEFEKVFASLLATYLREELVVDPATFLQERLRCLDADDDAALRATLACVDFEVFAAAMRRTDEEAKDVADAAGCLGL